jgi:hypothetical protein
MGVSSTKASLRAVREDLDLGGAGSILERAVLNKVNKRSGPVSLAEYKGNILGTQLILHKAWGGSPWKKIRNESSGHDYIDSANSDVYVSGNKICVAVCELLGDNGMEARLIGKVTESGRYRLTGKSYGRFSPYHKWGQLHIYCIANPAGYLSGTNKIKYGLELDSTSGSGQKTHSVEFNLDTGDPYITLCLRQINKYGGSIEYLTLVHDFWDWKLEKI